MFRIILKVQVKSKCLRHFSALLSANLLFSIFPLLYILCYLSFRSSLKIHSRNRGFFGCCCWLFEISLSLMWNHWKLYFRDFSGSSSMSQGTNPDQIFLACLWDCHREYIYIYKSNVNVYHIYCFPVIH